MDKIGIGTSCHHYQYNGMHLEIKGWSSGKKFDECFSNVERLMRMVTFFKAIRRIRHVKLRSLLFSKRLMLLFSSWLVSSFMLILNSLLAVAMFLQM